MKIIYCGYGRAGSSCLIELLSMKNINPEDILVFTHKKEANIEFLKLLKGLGIKFICKNINKCFETVKEFNPDYMISIYYRFIIRQEILNLCKDRAINCHSSLLPKYKGKFAPFWTIYNGEAQAGITYHYMINPVDSGKILFQERICLNKNETSFSLYHKISNLCIVNFKKAFQMLLDGKNGTPMPKLPKSNKTFEYYDIPFPFDGKISVENSDEEIFRFCRATYHPDFHPPIIFNANREIKVEGIPELNKIINLKKRLML